MSTKRKANADQALLKQALLKIEQLHAKVDEAQRTRHEPIAVIGMGCRLPQGVNHPDSFWEVLASGRDLVTDTPADRWDADEYYAPHPGASGKVYSKAGAFLDDVAGFDPQFFGIAPREAKSLDPQQRLLLEVSWEALENAGQSPDALAGVSAGVFFGIGGTDYQQLQMHQQDMELLDTYHASGVAHSVAAGRVSYALGLTGPSLAIDTACSSSLVAIHYACLSLRNSECRLALAGGVNLMLAPFSNIAFCQSSMISPAGRCATFDAAADGFVQGEGCGVIVLKRLSDALKDGDRVEAVIRGSAVNQDGASSGLTAPNGPAQEDVIMAALADSGVSPSDVSYVEAHGSGTPLGDPIEVQALGAALGRQRSADEPLLIGSVKTNAGHLATAAGVVGIIKVVLAMREKQIPPHLHFETPNPHIPWAQLPIEVAASLTDWRPSGKTRIAGVSGFGFSGTNVHIVLEEAPATADLPADRAAVQGIPLALSAKTEAALRTLAASYADDLSRRSDSELPDFLYTANTGRAHFKHRLVADGDTTRSLAQTLAEYSAGDSSGAARAAVVRSIDAPRVAFIFAGTGNEFVGMGRQLFETEPAFRSAVERCDESVRDRFGVSLVSALYAGSGSAGEGAPIGDERVAYPTLFAIEYALAALWRSWGVEPWAVTGHGIGEYVAACIAGALSLDDAIGLAAERGRLMDGVSTDGAMAIIFADLVGIDAAMEPLSETVSVAAINGPRQVVVSGVQADVERLCDDLSIKGIRSLPLPRKRALQSPLVDPVLEELEQFAGRLSVGRSAIGIVSGLTGETVSRARMRESSFWRDQAREPVLFSKAIGSLRDRGIELFVEIGPDAVLSGLGASTLSAPGGVWLPTLRKGKDDRQQMLAGLGQLYLRGVAIDWRGVFQYRAHGKVVLPGYPFERERYWIDGLKVRTQAPGGEQAAEHPLLGARIETPLESIIYQCDLSRDKLPVLHEHVVHGIVVVPAAAILEMVIAAGRGQFGSDEFDIADVSISEALTLEADADTRIQLVLTPNGNKQLEFQLFSHRDRDGGGSSQWRPHAAGLLAESHGTDATPRIAEEPFEAVAARCTTSIEVEQLYRGMRERGLEFGEHFRGIDKLRHGDGEALGEIRESAESPQSPYRFDPPVLDACIQVVSAALPGFDPNDTMSDIFMPIGIDRLRISAVDSAPALSHARIRQDAPQSRETLSADLRVSDSAGRTLLEFDGLHLKRADESALMRATAGNIEKYLYRIDWQPVGDPVPTARPVTKLVEPEAVGATVQAVVERLCETFGVNIYEKLSADLDTLCASYIVDALRKLGWSFEPGCETGLEDLLDELSIDSRHSRLVDRLLDILCEEGVLKRTGDRWTVQREPDLERSDSMISRLLETYTGCDAELRWTRNCGDKLAEALTGEADPHELLFPAGDTSLATTVYSKTPLAKLFNALTAEALKTVVAGLPSGRDLNVLEIGAGTGATTASLLEALPADRARYTFTDIGPAFVNQARRRFSDYAFADFKVLDIERSPEDQGFVCEQYDLIVASNVLHATADLRETVRHVAGLLAPGGLLVLLEVTAQQRWFDLTVGLTDGWWRFADPDLRPKHALLSSEEWGALLGECGFGVSAVVPDRAHPAFEQAMIIAKRLDPAATADDAESPEPREDWFILSDDAGLGAVFAEQLGLQGANCISIRKASGYRQDDANTFYIDPSNRDHFDRFISEFPTSDSVPQRFVYLWPLDAGDDDSVDALAATQAEICGGALHLVQVLGSSTSRVARLAIVTRGAQAVEAGVGPVHPAQATLWGLNKAIALEHPELRSLAIDLDPTVHRAEDEVLGLIDEIRHRADENEIGFRLGGAYVSRLVRTAFPRSLHADMLASGGAAGLKKPASGLLEDLQLQPMERRDPGPGEVEIRVHASSLNFRDVLVALDVHHDFDSIGSECAGRITAVGPGVTDLEPGDDVVAIAPRSLATHAIASEHLTVRRPRNLCVEDAVTLPIAFLTADYALNNAGRMAAGDVVLIHAAAGGVGMAALQLARRAGATILATAGSDRKRRYLRELGVEHVSSSRNFDFAEQAMKITDGRGVDIVLNGLTGEFIEKGLQILAPGGRFLELGKSDIWDNDRVRRISDQVEYHAVDLTGDMLDNPQDLRPMFDKLVQRVEKRELTPLPWQGFPLDHGAEAFRFMEQAQHIGKVVLTQRDPNDTLAGGFRADASYLIVGGLSGLGERIAEWAVEQGARHLVLAGRREPSQDTFARISALEARGAIVVVSQCDVSRETEVRSLLAEIDANGPPLRGVFHSAGILDDGLLLQQDWSRFKKVMAPKVEGAWLLHTLTDGESLDFFVMFSSVASVLGGSGAGNHSAANAFLDSLAHHRRHAGMQGLSINWGAWSEIGAAARKGASQHVASQGLGFIRPADGLQALRAAMHSDVTQVGVISIDWPVFFERDATQRQRSLLAELADATEAVISPASSAAEEPATAQSDLIERLQAAYPNKRQALIEEHVAMCAGAILGLDPASIDPRQPLTEMGLDSLMAVELRNTIRGSIGQQLPATLLFDYPTVDALSRYLGDEVLVIGESAEAPEVEDEFDLLASIENLSDEEVDRVLGQELE